jgi:hypothetical protein
VEALEVNFRYFPGNVRPPEYGAAAATLLPSARELLVLGRNKDQRVPVEPAAIMVPPEVMIPMEGFHEQDDFLI